MKIIPRKMLFAQSINIFSEKITIFYAEFT